MHYPKEANLIIVNFPSNNNQPNPKPAIKQKEGKSGLKNDAETTEQRVALSEDKENWQALRQPNHTEEKIQVNKVEIQRFYYNR